MMDKDPPEEPGKTPKLESASEFTVRRRRISQVDIIEVFEHELDELEAAYAEANQSLNFTTALFGIFIALIVPVLTNPSINPYLGFILSSAAFASGIAAIWFFIRWLRKRKLGPALLARIKKRRPEIAFTQEIRSPPHEESSED